MNMCSCAEFIFIRKLAFYWDTCSKFFESIFFLSDYVNLHKRKEEKHEYSTQQKVSSFPIWEVFFECCFKEHYSLWFTILMKFKSVDKLLDLKYVCIKLLHYYIENLTNISQNFVSCFFLYMERKLKYICNN